MVTISLVEWPEGWNGFHSVTLLGMIHVCSHLNKKLVPGSDSVSWQCSCCRSPGMAPQTSPGFPQCEISAESEYHKYPTVFILGWSVNVDESGTLLSRWSPFSPPSHALPIYLFIHLLHPDCRSPSHLPSQILLFLTPIPSSSISLHKWAGLPHISTKYGISSCHKTMHIPLH